MIESCNWLLFQWHIFQIVIQIKNIWIEWAIGGYWNFVYEIYATPCRSETAFNLRQSRHELRYCYAIIRSINEELFSCSNCDAGIIEDVSVASEVGRKKFIESNRLSQQKRLIKSAAFLHCSAGFDRSDTRTVATCDRVANIIFWDLITQYNYMPLPVMPTSIAARRICDINSLQGWFKRDWS